MVSDYETDGSGTVVERYNKGADAVQALKQGKLDCVIIDELPAQAFVKQNEGLKILEENFVEEDYAFVIAKGNEALVDQVNEALRELKDEGVLDNIAKNYTGTDEEIGKYPYENLDVERTNGTLTVGTNAEFPHEARGMSGGWSGRSREDHRNRHGYYAGGLRQTRHGVED